ncbi:MAG: hypothetical protein QM398_12215 [Thermoproteota archaeon]|nr:hypothetical protein [Thermoproteota archaeon]
MNDAQLRILKTMREAKTRMNLQMFAKAVNLNPDQTIVQIHELTHEGFIRKTDSGYGLTEKGKNALKITTPFSDEVAFCFYLDIDKTMGFIAHSLEDFYLSINQVCCDSIEFHFYRGDFNAWLRDVIHDTMLADEIVGLTSMGLVGEDLRTALLKLMDVRYGVGDLL